MENKTYKRKENCGFFNIGCCSFKAYDCKPEKCDMYNIEFNSKSIKKELDNLKSKVIKLTKENLKLKKVKKFINLEKDQNNSDIVKQYKKKLLLIEDLAKGVEYLEKAFIHTKRTKK